MKKLADWIIGVMTRKPPDFIIGGYENPYLYRWRLLPHNPLFNLYVHCIVRADDDRALHDHPWFWGSYIFKGSYFEITDKGRKRYDAGSFRIHSPWFRHRLEPIDSHVWTLFFLWFKMRSWGFWCPQGFVHWKKFVASDDKGSVGKGCDQ